MALKDPDHGIAKILSALGADKEALSGHGQGEGLGLGRALCLGGRADHEPGRHRRGYGI